MSERYITLGIDKRGEVYGLCLKDGSEDDFVKNSLGYSTSCAVIRPVDRRTLDYCREDTESIKDTWKLAVEHDRTELGLDDYFEDALSECCSVFGNDEEAYPGKDESFCDDLLLDDDNPTVKTYWMTDSGLRAYVEKCIRESPFIDTGNVDKHDIATWESAGWYPPKEPFVVELAPHEFLEKYYKHLEETYPEFKR